MLVDDWVVRVPGQGAKAAGAEPLLMREWLVTNALGGYASGTIAGVASRRYHGLLVAALPTPFGRRTMLNHLSELIRLPDGTRGMLGGEEPSGALGDPPGSAQLIDFRLELGLPVWHYQVGGAVVEKRVLLLHGQNTAHIQYRLIEGETARLKIRPSLHFRPHDAPLGAESAGQYALTAVESRYEVATTPPSTPLRMYLHGGRSAFTLECKEAVAVHYAEEESRGYPANDTLWSPGYFRVDLSRDSGAALVASTEAWESILALGPQEALEAEHERRRHLLACAQPPLQVGPAQELVLAADQFIVRPAGRVEDAARAQAAGDEARTIIAGYHWFTDWGRDTMISLEGLTLVTGRQVEAGYILRTFSHYIRDGLIPNLFPEHQRQGLYHTADATLWYFHAVDRYLAATNDRETLRLLLPKLKDIVDHHIRGTRFGIGVDPADGLLREGAVGYQLTWMDAKVGDWVVTPRRGKAVEINALWYNALRLLEGWVRAEEGNDAADRLAAHAERARRSFNARFWYEEGRLSLRRGGRRSGRRSRMPAQSDLCYFSCESSSRARPLGAGSEYRERAIAYAGWPTLAGPGPPRLQVEILRRSSSPRRRLSPGHRLGMAHRPVHRRLAEGPSGRPHRGTPISRRSRQSPVERVYRIDQRSL